MTDDLLDKFIHAALGDPPYRCKKCNMVFDTRRGFKSHLTQAHGWTKEKQKKKLAKWNPDKFKDVLEEIKRFMLEVNL